MTVVENRAMKRPCVGQSGEKQTILANLFPISNFTSTDIYHYDVSITPEASRKASIALFKDLYKSNFEGLLSGIVPAYDGAKSLYSSMPLPFDDFLSITRQQPGARGKEYVINIKKVAVIDVQTLRDYLLGADMRNTDHLVAISALDVALRTNSLLSKVYFGRSFFIPKNKTALSGGLETWTGFYQAIRPTKDGLMLNMDLSHSAFYEEVNLVDVVVKLLRVRGPEELKNGLTKGQVDQVNRFLATIKFQILHRQVDRTFTIKYITLQSADKTIFKVDGKDMSITQYFSQNYRLKIQYPYLPCVVTPSKTTFPLELCKIAPGQRYLKKLSTFQSAEMIKKTAVKPQARVAMITDGFNELNLRNNQILNSFDVKVEPQLISIRSRVLPAPMLVFNEKSVNKKTRPQFGQWRVNNSKAHTSKDLIDWSILSFASEVEVSRKAVERFVQQLKTTCTAAGTKVDQPVVIDYMYFDYNKLEDLIMQHYNRVGNKIKRHPKFIMIVLRDVSAANYGKIKLVTDNVLKVATQCVQYKHVGNAKEQYCQNLCLKINVKLGGINCTLEDKLIVGCNDPYIIIGADMTHPGTGEEGNSIAALTASVNRTCTRYVSCFAEQKREDTIAHLKPMVYKLLRAFFTINEKKAPKKIIFFRDGVSEGQFNEVLEKEFTAIKEACEQLDKNYKPAITFIVVQKRHHVRFFPKDSKHMDKSGNCLPGTVVDSCITHPTQFDFFPQSHGGLLGTSRPAHYHVLKDESSFQVDAIQSLTYSLCFLYSRSTTSVSIVAPVYYASLVSERARLTAKARDVSVGVLDREADWEELLKSVEVKNWMYFV